MGATLAKVFTVCLNVLFVEAPIPVTIFATSLDILLTYASVPIWDCRSYFLTKDGQPLKKDFSVQDILTQLSDSDNLVTDKEIPENSLVAVHVLPNAYTSNQSSLSCIGLNVIGVQVLVTPKAAVF